MELLSDQVAVVTGAASGIGLAVTRALAKEGVHVAMLDIESEALKRAKDSIVYENKVIVQDYVVDVSDRAGMRAVAKQVNDHFGHVHILLNNAGIDTMLAVDEMTDNDWDWCMGVNLDGVINGLQSFLPLMTSHGKGGHIINTSSIFGMYTMEGQSAYSAAKYAIVGLSESARLDLAPKNIGVSVLCPGVIATNILTGHRNRPTELAASNDAGYKRLEALIPYMASTGLPAENVAEQILHGIRKNKAYIFTHAEIRRSIEARFKQIIDSFDGSEEVTGGDLSADTFASAIGDT